LTFTVDKPLLADTVKHENYVGQEENNDESVDPNAHFIQVISSLVVVLDYKQVSHHKVDNLVKYLNPVQLFGDKRLCIEEPGTHPEVQVNHHHHLEHWWNLK